MTNIFDVTKEKTVPQWAKFKVAGDSIQGTYVGKIVGLIDGYGNEQIVYQLLQENGEVINVGFGLNKKMLNADMQQVKFGQIIGFRYKGMKQIKDKFGKPAQVKDFAFHQDPKIVDEKWLKENAGNMPTVVQASNNSETPKSMVPQSATAGDAELDDFVDEEKKVDDVPFSSKGNLTNEDKLAAIEKIAKEKLGATDAKSVKDKVMEKTGIAFIPVNFSKILEALATL